MFVGENLFMRICRFSGDAVKKEKIVSGIGPNFYYMSKELSELGVEEHVICHGFGDDKIGNNTYLHGIPVTSRFGLHYGKMYVIPFGLMGLLKFKKLHKKHPFDIIQGHNYDPYLITKLKYFTDNVPTVVTFHAVLKGFQRMSNDLVFSNLGQKIDFKLLSIPISMERSICESADSLVAISENEKKDLIEGYGADKRKITVIYNGVDTEHFNPDIKAFEIRERYKIKSDPLVVYVGGIGIRKGIPYLIESIPHVLKEIPNAKFLLVGGSDTDFQNKLLARINKLNIQKSVIFTGSVNHFDLPKYYGAADIYAMAPLYDDIPKAILEAMACGKAVVSTGVDGIPEIVDKNSGILVPPRDPEKFANAIIKLLSDKELSEKLGKNGRELMVKKYTWKQTAEQYLNLYEKLSNS